MSQIFPIPIVKRLQSEPKQSPTDKKPPEHVSCENSLLLDESDIILISSCLDSDVFRSASNYREQVGLLCQMLRDDLSPYPMSYEKIGSLFCPSKSPSTIREQEIKYKNGVKANGRPRLLSEKEEEILKQKILDFFDSEGYPTYDDISDMIVYEFNKYLSYPSIRSIINRMSDFKTTVAYPLEAGRYLCPYTDIEEYYNSLQELLKGVPIGWLFNLDETGEQDFVDSRTITVIVPSSTCTSTRTRYSVDRNGKRATVLHCICSDGKYLPPLFVLPRKTVDVDIFDEINQDDVMFAESPTGFMNTEIFCKYIDQVFIPYVHNKRSETGYEGKAILIMDGFSAHHKCVEDENRKRILEEENIQILFLPPHSSDQVQPLDLVTFNLQKQWKKKAKYNKQYSYQTKQILETYNSLLMASTPHYIKSAFERAGIYRTKLVYNEEQRIPQFHVVDITLNECIRNAPHEIRGKFEKNLYIERIKLAHKETKFGSARKTIPVKYFEKQ